MPYSPTHHYVFIAVPKTGTTSVIRALKGFHRREGGEISLVADECDDAFRRRYGLDALGDPQPGRAKHLSALQLSTILGDEYARSFTFSMVRNPWARLVSRYRFKHIDNAPENPGPATRRSFHDLEFKEWMRRRWEGGPERWGRSQRSKLVDADGRLIVEFVGRIERIQEDFDHACERIGLPHIELPHSNRSNPAGYVEYYDDRTRGMVEEMCREDIEEFGYRFGG